MTSPDAESKCRTCDQPHPNADGTVPLHPFNDGQAGATAFLRHRDRSVRKSPQNGSEGVSRHARPAFPMDPVLRQALVDLGIITPQNLRDAEEKIQAVTGLFNQAGPVMRGESDGQ